MSNGDRTPEERLAAIEALMVERKDTTKTWQDRADTKLDKLLSNSKNVVTLDVLKDSFTAHITSCPSRNPSNPGPKNNSKNGVEKIDWVLKGYRGLGIVGSMVVLNAMQLLIILKLTKVL